jgi:hypothetical protein
LTIVDVCGIVGLEGKMNYTTELARQASMETAIGLTPEPEKQFNHREYDRWDALRGFSLLFLLFWWPFISFCMGIKDVRLAAFTAWELFFMGMVALMIVSASAIRHCKRLERLKKAGGG